MEGPLASAGAISPEGVAVLREEDECKTFEFPNMFSWSTGVVLYVGERAKGVVEEVLSSA